MDFCSVSFAETFKDVYGTVPPIDRLLLLEYNEPWSDHPIEQNNLPVEVNHFLRECLDQSIFSRIFFIRNNKSIKGVVNLFTVNNRQVDPFVRHFVLREHSDLLEIDINACFEEAHPHFDKDIFLVCTNGKTDKCCSKFGLPVYKMLTSMDDQVWQCTHITGCRFAPNVVHLPYVHYYGHLSIDELFPLHQAVKQKVIYAPKYRGRTCYTHEEQAAEYFLRKDLDDYRFDQLILDQTCIREETFNCSFHYREREEKYIVQLNCVKSAEEYQMNCAGSSNPIEKFTLISIRQIDSLNCIK